MYSKRILTPFPDYAKIGLLREDKVAHKWIKGFSGSLVVKNLPAKQEMQVQSLGQKVPFRRKWKLTP